MKLRVHKVSLEAGSQHPNKMKFRGVLVRLDEASTKPPNGAHGHRIMIPVEIAKERLGSLIGMGLNYDRNLDGHDQRRKVGVIEKAWIEGKNLCVSGHIWKHDFPEAEKDLKQPGLGMSMELVDVSVENPKANIWTLADFQFSGATILYRDAAAYYKTHAIAAKADKRSTDMAKTATKTVKKVESADARIARIAAKAATDALQKGLDQATGTLAGLIGRQTTLLAGMDTRLKALESADGTEEDDMEADKVAAEGDIESAKKDAADDPEDQEDNGDDEADEVDAEIDEGDLEQEDSAEGEEKPGHIADEVKYDQGNKSNVENKTGPNVSASIAALTAQVAALTQQLAASETARKTLAKRVKRQEVQVKAAGERTSRRSVDPQVFALLQKSHINPADLFASGQRLNVSEVDSIIANWVSSTGAVLSSSDRMSLKNMLLQNGLMEDGKVERRVQ